MVEHFRGFFVSGIIVGAFLGHHQSLADYDCGGCTCLVTLLASWLRGYLALSARLDYTFLLGGDSAGFQEQGNATYRNGKAYSSYAL